MTVGFLLWSKEGTRLKASHLHNIKLCQVQRHRKIWRGSACYLHDQKSTRHVKSLRRIAGCFHVRERRPHCEHGAQNMTPNPKRHWFNYLFESCWLLAWQPMAATDNQITWRNYFRQPGFQHTFPHFFTFSWGRMTLVRFSAMLVCKARTLTKLRPEKQCVTELSTFRLAILQTHT